MCNRVRIGSGLVAALLAIVGSAVLACGSASAVPVHVFSKTFGTGELAMTKESGIAVSQESGDIYLADTKHSRIAKFTAAGVSDGNLATIQDPTAIAVDNSAGSSKGDVYVAGEGAKAIFKLNVSGQPVTSWALNGRLAEPEELVGIAVDSEGDLWVVSHHVVLESRGLPQEDTVTARVFDEAGTLISGRGWTRTYTYSFALPSDVALDATGDLYMLNEDYISNIGKGEWYERTPEKFSPTGEILLKRFVTAGNNANLGIGLDLSMSRAYLGAVPAPEGIVNKTGEYPASVFGFSLDGTKIEHFGGDYEGPVYMADSSIDHLYEISSIAVVESSHVVYVADPHENDIVVFGLEEVQAPTATIESSSIEQHSAKVIAKIDPNAPAGSTHAHDVSWYIQCTPTCPGHNEFTPGYIEADGHEHTAETTLAGLEAGTEYSVLLVVENRGGRVERTVSVTTAPAAPTVRGEAVSEVFHGEATLNAGIGPGGAETAYFFEYMTKSAYEVEGGFVGSDVKRTSGATPIAAKALLGPVSARVEGLEPATDYVYRTVASNLVGTTDGEAVFFRSQIGPNPLDTVCPNQALRTEVGARLPDCRAYEMVTPVEKGGNLVEPYAQGLQAAADGSGVTWFTGQSATGVPSARGGHQGYAFYLSTLAGGSWTSQRLLAPQQYGGISALVGLTGDERYALIETAAYSGRNGAGEERRFEPALYLLDTATHELSAIVPPQVGREELPRAFALDGASADDSLIFFESHLRLTSNATPDKNNLYVWNRESGVLALAGVLPGAKGEAPAGGSFGGAYSWWGGYLNLDTGGAEEALYVEAVHAISETGDAVYFTAGETDQLYLRHGLTGPKPTTVRVSVANAGVSDTNGEKPAAFQEATPDGSKAFFLSSGKLTQNANTGSADEGSDLYRYDSAAKTPLVDVSPLLGGAGARVQGLLGVSADGRSGYLVAKGVLAAKGVEGDSNVYHFQEEGGGTFAYTFVADLGSASRTPAERDWSPTADLPKTARVSKDGGTVLFMSQRPLTGLPEDPCIVVGSCMQVYRYSMSEGSVECLSCNPTGEGAPLFGAELTLEGEQTLTPENHIRKPGNAISGILPANLSSSGARAFFQSSERLLPEDVNGAEPRQNCGHPLLACVDVYEWEAVGTGSCRTPNQANGCLYLLSSGESDRPSYFINASSDGSSAFILTSSSLVPADRDELTDIYDVREDGGLAAQHASAVKPCGSSEACRGPASTVSPGVSPGSLVFSGLGNFLGVPSVRTSGKPKPKPEPKQCRKGFVQKHDKCVKRPKRHKQKHPKRKPHEQHRTTAKKRSGGAK